jgi:hypothetical protein
VQHRLECLSADLEELELTGPCQTRPILQPNTWNWPIPYSVWQQRNFREENVIGALPPLLRNAEDLEDIILDLIYQRTRPALQLPSLFTLSEGFCKKHGRPTSSTFTIELYSMENSPRTMKMCGLIEWCWCHSQRQCAYTRDSY